MAALIRGSAERASAALIFSWLALSAGYTVEAIPDRSEFGSAGHVAAGFFVLFVASWVCEGKWRELGLGLDLRAKCVRRSLAFIVGVVGAFVLTELGLCWAGVISREAIGEPRGALIEALVFQLVVVSVEEELLWRGLLQSRVDELFVRRVQVAGASLGLGALVSFLLFGLTHMVRLDLQPLALSFHPSGAFLFGALYVYLRGLTGSIWPSVALHGLWNGHNVVVKALVWL